MIPSAAPPSEAAPPLEEEAPYRNALPSSPSAFARLRSRLVRECLARVAPASMLVTRGRSRDPDRAIALTFDDGPDPMTPEYLKALDRLGVRATFFLIGENMARAPEMVAEYVRRGHEVAGHGYTHTPFPTLAGAQLIDELSRTNDLLPPSLSPRPLVRPPQGRVTPTSVLRVAAAGYVNVLWSLDSDDCRTRDPKQVAARVAPAHVRPGEIVLLHEMQPWTLEALGPIVDGLRGAGYALVTVGELLGY